jgi:type IX secretion system PorP/SprF family membrane protein
LNNSIITLIILFCLFKSTTTFGQEIIFPTLTYNTQNYNPAYVSALNHAEITLNGNAHWMNFKGFPITLNLTSNLPIKKIQSAIGLNFQRYSIGASSEWNYKFLWSSYIRTKNNWKLNFGLAIGAKTFNLEGTKLEPGIGVDNSVPINQTTSKLDLDLGIMLSKGEKFFLGFSTKDILNQGFNLNNTELIGSRNYFIYSHFYQKFGNIYGLRPYFFMPIGYRQVQIYNGLIHTFGKGIQFGTSLSSEFLNGNFTFLNTISVLAGFENNRFRIVYGFEFNPNSANAFNQAKHNIQLAYKFMEKE